MSTNPSQRLKIELQVSDSHADPVALLAEASGLSRARIKDAMSKGAVSLQRNATRKRLRRAKSRVGSGDRLTLCYDPELLARVAPQAEQLATGCGYEVWYKPAGLLSQGTPFGDHCSLLRQVERGGSGAFLVHRLDREAFGLMIVATDRAVARALSNQFAQRQVDKRYRVLVLGHPRQDRLDDALDGRPARTWIDILDAGPRHTLVEARIETGRRHQIRRHLAGVGCPVLGDPVYGQNNADPGGLALCASYLAIQDPGDGDRRVFELPERLRPRWFSGLPPEKKEASVTQ